MDGADRSEVDVTVAAPTALAHVVAGALVGRYVRLTWSSRAPVGDDDENVTLG